jgi:hypothetical protein
MLPGMATCTVEECTNPVNARGLCHRHYKRWQTHGDPTVTLSRRLDGATVAEKLAAYVDRSAGPDACWPWTRGRSTDGYGRLYPPRGAVAIAAHRAAFEQANGPIAAGREVLHSCDNPPCCNPAHLRVGTHAENMAEMSDRGRASCGVANPRAKMTDADVAEARRMKAEGALNREIAARFGVSQPYVSRLTRGERR